ncbi:hypothetical protein [Microvirga arsenatis]|uniref:hypothetical protein n=1 Tax=Microvirga arsenatis TaxID=2692265 RepID=UPI001AEE51B5|nr:hypothetical protein [Microvirga arsenatis]NBJ13108.1 hypothetical protein [Microvirga arsenatis]
MYVVDAIALDEGIGALGNSGKTGKPHRHSHALRPGPAEALLSVAAYRSASAGGSRRGTASWQSAD